MANETNIVWMSKFDKRYLADNHSMWVPSVVKTKEIMLNNTEKFKLHRQTTRSLNNDSIESLEELSFVNIFPFGKNCYKEPRDLKFAIGMSNYVKCRLPYY